MAQLSNTELLAQVKHLAEREREATATLIAHLTELDERRLYLDEGCSSLFTYCTQILHLSEHAAYGRIVAARAVRGLASRRRTVRLHKSHGTPVHRTGLRGVPSRHTPRCGRRDDGREHPAPVSRAQWL